MTKYLGYVIHLFSTFIIQITNKLSTPNNIKVDKSIIALFQIYSYQIT